MAVRIGRRLIFGNLLDYVALADGVEVRRIVVGGHVVGRSIQDLDVRKAYGINIIAVEREGRTDVEFTANYRFAQGNTITVVGQADKIDRFEQEMQD